MNLFYTLACDYAQMAIEIKDKIPMAQSVIVYGNDIGAKTVKDDIRHVQKAVA